MNQSQIVGILRILLAAGMPLGALIATVGIDPKQFVDWLVAGIPIVMAVWSYFGNTHGNIALAAGSIKGVEVLATTEAPADVQKIAKDPNVKDVNMAPPARVTGERK
jgi:hypothetical protein